MSDADLIRAALHAHHSYLPGLSGRSADALARVIASHYSTGGDDHSYAFISTGTIPDNPQRLWRRLAPAPGDIAPADRPALDFLAGYLLRHAGRGPVPGWRALWLSAEDGQVR